MRPALPFTLFCIPMALFAQPYEFGFAKDPSSVYFKHGTTSTVDRHPFGPGFRLWVNFVYWFYFKVFTPPTNATSRPAQ
jgi:hypothetical protein